MSLTLTHAPPTGLLPVLGCFNIEKLTSLPITTVVAEGRHTWIQLLGEGANPQVSSPYIQSVNNPQNPDLILKANPIKTGETIIENSKAEKCLGDQIQAFMQL